MVIKDIGRNHVRVVSRDGLLVSDYYVEDCPKCPMFDQRTTWGTEERLCQNFDCPKRKKDKNNQ